MANKDVYMDTRVFTDIVNRIGVASSKCVLSTDPLSKTDAFEKMRVGKEMNEILKLYYKSTEVYRNETSDSLPRALLKVRDSMIEQDRILSEGLTVEKNRR
jgi:hypothetical protein